MSCNLPAIECPFDIPSPFKWNESFRVFYNKLDNEHKGLFDGVLNVIEHNNKASATKAAEAFEHHFKSEEGEMKRAVDVKNLDQEYLDSHTAAHKDFLCLFKCFEAPLSDEQVNYSMKWLVKHIKSTDFEYKDKLLCTK